MNVFTESLQAWISNLSINSVIMMIMMIFMLVGAIDKIIGNKFGYGEKFEEGFNAIGPLALSMAGVVAAAPVLSTVLGPIITPIYTAIGADASMFATTLREVVSANDNLWGAILHVDGQWYVEQPRNIPILDRIGGGDGFVSGLLYGVLRGWEPEKCLQFGWASGALVVTLLTDYATPADEEQIWSIYAGNARVKR